MWLYLPTNVWGVEGGLKVSVQRHGGLTVNRQAGKYFMNKDFKSEQEQLVSAARLPGPPHPD